MSSSAIPPLKLFPLYPGGPVREVRSLGNTQFNIRSNEFSNTYAVNAPSTRNPFENGVSWKLSQGGQIEQTRADGTNYYNRNLEIDNSSSGRLTSGSIPNRPPEVPESYRNQVARYEINDSRFNELMAQSSFDLPNIGMGLRVTTDGQGGVANIALNPSAFAVQQGFYPGGLPNGPNRTEISTNAVFKVDPSSIPIPSGASKAVKPMKTVLNNAVQPSTTVKAKAALNPLLPGGQPFKPGDGSHSLAPGAADFNPVLARLAQLSTPNQGLTLTGINSQVSVTQARNLASVRAGFDVSSSDNFQQNMAQWASNARLQESYTTLHRPTPIDRLMDGRIGMNATVTPPLRGSQGLSFGTAAMDVEGLTKMADVLDSASRRSAGGYVLQSFVDTSTSGEGSMPFNSNSDGGSGQMNFSGGGQGQFSGEFTSMAGGDGSSSSGSGQQSQSPFVSRRSGRQLFFA